jgi:hypothetical protein
MKKIPSNVVRCLEDDGPILYPLRGGSYKCETCGGGVKSEQAQIGTHWEESYGYLVTVETVDDERDTEEEVSDLYSAISVFADILGDGMTASGVGGHFTCSEANRLAEALMVGGHKRAAMTFLQGHAEGDYETGDEHGVVDDFEAYVTTVLMGQEPVEFEPEPEPKVEDSFTVEIKAAIVTTEELLKLMNLN